MKVVDKDKAIIEDQPGMNKKDLKKFRDLLQHRREEILKTADVTKERGMGFSLDDLPDVLGLVRQAYERQMGNGGSD